MNSVAEIAIGAAVEVGICTIAGAVVYRLFAGRFIIPKREIVLPYQRGVLVSGSEQLRVVGPGPCWVRPGRKLLLCDVRPLTLQMENVEVQSIEGTPVRFSISGEYGISDPGTFFSGSANAGDSLWFELRRVISSRCRQWTAAAISAPEGSELLARSVLADMEGSSNKIGMKLLSLEIWDVLLRESADPIRSEEQHRIQ